MGGRGSSSTSSGGGGGHSTAFDLNDLLKVVHRSTSTIAKELPNGKKVDMVHSYNTRKMDSPAFIGTEILPPYESTNIIQKIPQRCQ